MMPQVDLSVMWTDVEILTSWVLAGSALAASTAVV